MDNEKIGKFIRDLRKAKKLTQQELGDMVGVGGKSVSKWERGINMPDISIINEVSRILDITSDELLNGEFDRKSDNEEYKKKKYKRNTTLAFIFLIILATAITGVLVLYLKNDTHNYFLTSIDEGFSVSGNIEYDKKEYVINIDKIFCNFEECDNLYINDLQYLISLDDTIVYMNNGVHINDFTHINDYLQDKIITINDKYENSVMSYNQFRKLNDASIIIEGYDGDEKQFKYKINLKITDK